MKGIKPTNQLRMNTEFCVTIVPIGKRKPVEKLSHKLKINSDGEYECTWCSKSSLKMSTIVMHITMKHALEEGRAVNPYVCNHCDKSFSSSSIRRNHIKNYHEVECIACPHPGCDVTSKTKGNLVTHYGQRHIDFFEYCQVVGDNKFKCLTCDISMDKPKMSRHLATCISSSPFCKEAK